MLDFTWLKNPKLQNSGIPFWQFRRKALGLSNSQGTNNTLDYASLINKKVSKLFSKIHTISEEQAYNIPISSTKSMVGHSLGASGALEIIACIKSTIHDEIHPTINLENPDPECDLNYVPGKKLKKKVDVALSNSFGFGGQNACVVIKKY